MRGIEETFKRTITGIEDALKRTKELMDAQAKMNEAKGKATAAGEKSEGDREDPQAHMARLKRDAAKEAESRGVEQAAARDKIEQEELEAEQLAYDAMLHREAGSKIKVAKKEDDEQTLKDLENQAEAAKKDAEAARKRRGEIVENQAGEDSWWSSVMMKIRSQLTGLTPDQQLTDADTRIWASSVAQARLNK